MKAELKDPFRHLGDSNRESEHTLAMKRRRDQRRLRRSFNKWSPVCEHILESLGNAYNGRLSLLQKALVFLFGRHNLFWYLMQNRIGHRVSVDQSTLAWHLYVRDVQDQAASADYYFSYEQFCDPVYNHPYVSISFAVDTTSEPSGFRVTIGEDNITHATELTEHALVELLRRQVLNLL